ncbi:MAG: hypothetical protein ONB05_02145 [candidate division KSB1 bacterium]|nr:hypothetical protein [candidate division KSB1 bacterium]
MARRATYIKQNSSPKELQLILDVGDFVGGSGKINELRAEYLLKGFSLLNYDAINLGERDFLLGSKFLQKMKQKYHLPFISANVYEVATGELFTEPFVIKKFRGTNLKVGIFGLMMQADSLTQAPDEIVLSARNPVEVARQVVPQLQSQCDLIIALAHLGFQEAKQLAQNVEGIDVIISGHGYGSQPEPLKVNQALIVQSKNRGQTVGDLRLILDNEKNIISYAGKLIPLDSSIKDDEKLAALIAEYKTKSKE